ncbi:type II DNA modification methyltransferase [Spirochaetia bacterium]|nr:type II DNA modification methyltransferase [Spirochaetia bacterium]
MKTLTIVDMFAGAGGESTGIMQAAEQLGYNINLTAINHWERAVETHSHNHPSAEHFCESVEHLDPVKVVPGQKIDLLWASPECTHHSVARGGKPRSNQSRASAWIILDWLSKLQVKRVIIENVPEFTSWGPLDENGRIIKAEKGITFNAFTAALRSLGYTVEWNVLNAANYGGATTRKRLFIQAVKGNKKILWPDVTNCEKGIKLPGWKSAKDIIDRSVHGGSIFSRKRPLADATLRRIEHGIKKYWGEYAEPFLVVLRGTGTSRSINAPVNGITCAGHHALVEPFLLPNEGYYRGNQPRTIATPLSGITASRGFGAMIEPFITSYHGGHNGGRDGDKRNYPLDKPLPVIDTSNRYGLVESYKFDIGFRMLQPHELKAAMGFPETYNILGTKEEQTRQIGNAVEVNGAKALARTVLEN